jgi:hypothetical protein
MVEWLKQSKEIADWFVGPGTVLLAIVALFAAKIERRWFRPKLVLQPFKKIVLSPETKDYVGFKRLVLLCIKNKGGVAKDAEVFVHSVLRKAVHGKDEPMDNIVPMSLRWSNREDPHPEIFVTISPGMQRYFILGALKCRQSPPPSHDVVYFQLWTEFKLTKDSDELIPGEYIVKIYVTAATAKPKLRSFRLTVPNSFENPRVQIRKQRRQWLGFLKVGRRRQSETA